VRPDVGKWTLGVAHGIWRMVWHVPEILLEGQLPREGTTVLWLILGVQQKDQHECCQDMAGWPFTAGSPGISASLSRLKLQSHHMLARICATATNELLGV